MLLYLSIAVTCIKYYYTGKYSYDFCITFISATTVYMVLFQQFLVLYFQFTAIHLPTNRLRSSCNVTTERPSNRSPFTAITNCGHYCWTISWLHHGLRLCISVCKQRSRLWSISGYRKWFHDTRRSIHISPATSIDCCHAHDSLSGTADSRTNAITIETKYKCYDLVRPIIALLILKRADKITMESNVSVTCIWNFYPQCSTKTEVTMEIWSLCKRS